MKAETLNETGLKPVLNWEKDQEIGCDVYSCFSMYNPLTNRPHNLTVCYRNRVVNRLYAYVDDHYIDGFETVDDGKIECEKYLFSLIAPMYNTIQLLADNYKS